MLEIWTPDKGCEDGAFWTSIQCLIAQAGIPWCDRGCDCFHDGPCIELLSVELDIEHFVVTTSLGRFQASMNPTAQGTTYHAACAARAEMRKRRFSYAQRMLRESPDFARAMGMHLERETP